MNKNPYEVRLDVMKMAQEMLDKEHYAKEQKYLQKLRQMEKYQDGGIYDFIENNAPQAYSTTDVISRANELYNFISSNSRTDAKDK